MDKNELIRSISNDIGLTAEIKSTARTGKINTSNSQLIRVRLKDTMSKMNFIRNVKYLKSSQTRRTIYIKPELIPQQRQQEYELRKIYDENGPRNQNYSTTSKKIELYSEIRTLLID